MMSFCKKSVHSFLALSNIGNTSTNCTNTSNFSQDSSQRQYSRNIPSPAVAGGGGLTFFTVSGDIPRPVNVIESSTFKPPLYSPAVVKRDPGGVGFLDDVGGSVDGLMSCTESLGFESSDERRVDDKIENNINDGMRAAALAGRSRKVEKREVRKFPPPLSSLSDDGKRTFFLRPVRKDGRLELTEVKIHRPEILRASRQDGRLILHLIEDETEDDDDVDKNNNHNCIVDDVVKDENEEDDVNEEKEEERVEGWHFPASSGNGEGFRRCHEAVVGHHHHHHHHNLHGWGQHCVTIR